MKKKILKWLFREELNNLQTEIRLSKDQRINLESQEKRIKNLLNNLDVSIDVHQYSPSWAVISIQGEKQDFIKFIELGEVDIREIYKFLKKYDRQKVDASPPNTHFIKILKDEEKNSNYKKTIY